MQLSTQNRLKISLSKGAKIDPTGGVFSRGLITAVAVASLGEASGHGLWMDQACLDSCVSLMAAEEKGLKCRFTHPSYFSDGLGTYLGKLTDPVVANGQVVANLNFSEASTKGIFGNMADYIMSMAKETPEDLGLSVYGDYDLEAMAAFMVANGATTATYKDGTWTAPGFKSPDPANTGNLPHIRLAKLTGVDAVDENALNPGGLLAKFSAKDKEVGIMADLIAAEFAGGQSVGIIAALKARKIALAAEVVSANTETSTSTNSSTYGTGTTTETCQEVVTREETDTEIIYITTSKENTVRTERWPKTPAPAAAVVVPAVADPAAPAAPAAMSTKPAEANAELSAVVERLNKLEKENASMKIELAKKKFEANTGPGMVPADGVPVGEPVKKTGLAAKVSAAFKASGMKA